MVFILSVTIIFGDQKVNQIFEACFKIDRFKNGLAFWRLGQQRAGDQIGQLIRASNADEMLYQFLERTQAKLSEVRIDQLAELFEGVDREFEALVEALGDQFEHLGGERIDGDAITAGAFHRLDSLDAIRFVLDRLAELNSSQALENEMRAAVVVGHRDPNEAEAGYRRGRFTFSSGPLHGDRKHSMRRECLPQHLAIARLEDVEWEHGLREEDRVGEGHHRDLAGQLHMGLNVGEPVDKSRLIGGAGIDRSGLAKCGQYAHGEDL